MSGQPQQQTKEFGQPSTLSQIVTFFLTFIGGVIIGQTLPYVFVIDSWLAAALSLFMLPVTFITGMHLWLGFALISAVFSLVKNLLIHRKLPKRSSQGPPSGAFVFVPTGLFISAVVGIIVSLVSPGGRMLLVWTMYTFTGLAYGAALWQLAKRGYLPFPDEW